MLRKYLKIYRKMKKKFFPSREIFLERIIETSSLNGQTSANI